MPNNTDHAMADIVNAFLKWKLPESVSCDGCCTRPGNGRIGTNLLTCPEAVAMTQEVVRPIVERLLDQETAKLRSALVRTTGSLGLVIKGAKATATGHKENYDHALVVLAEADQPSLGAGPGSESHANDA